MLYQKLCSDRFDKKKKKRSNKENKKKKNKNKNLITRPFKLAVKKLYKKYSIFFVQKKKTNFSWDSWNKQKQ